MRRMLEKLLQTHGMEMRLIRGSRAWLLRGLLQPVRSRSLHDVEGDYIPLGRLPEGMLSFFGPVEPEARVGDTLEVGKKSYLVRRVDVVRGDNGPLYQWGLCVERGKVDTWG